MQNPWRVTLTIAVASLKAKPATRTVCSVVHTHTHTHKRLPQPLRMRRGLIIQNRMLFTRGIVHSSQALCVLDATFLVC